MLAFRYYPVRFSFENNFTRMENRYVERTRDTPLGRCRGTVTMRSFALGTLTQSYIIMSRETDVKIKVGTRLSPARRGSSIPPRRVYSHPAFDNCTPPGCETFGLLPRHGQRPLPSLEVCRAWKLLFDTVIQDKPIDQALQDALLDRRADPA